MGIKKYNPTTPGSVSYTHLAAILSISGIIVKLLGAALRIPLANKLGAGMAYYNVAYTIYAIFLVLATAGKMCIRDSR